MILFQVIAGAVASYQDCQYSFSQAKNTRTISRRKARCRMSAVFGSVLQAICRRRVGLLWQCQDVRIGPRGTRILHRVGQEVL